MAPFELEVWFGDRVAALGSNGSGKSHFLRLLALGGKDPDPRAGHLTTVGATLSPVERFEGTVIAVTHDRWFARSFDRFLVFGADGRVYESNEPVWDEARVIRDR